MDAKLKNTLVGVAGEYLKTEFFEVPMNDITLTVIVTFITTVVLKSLWDRWIGSHFIPIEKLLEQLRNGTIQDSGKKRLVNEAKQSLKRWEERCELPKDSEERNWPPSDLGLLVIPRSLTLKRDSSSFPLKAEDENTIRLYIRINEETEITRESGPIKFELSQDANTIKELISKKLDMDIIQNSGPLIKILDKSNSTIVSQVWIDAPGIIFRSKEEVQKCVDNIVTEVRNRIPNAKIVLEIFLADDLIELYFNRKVESYNMDNILAPYSSAMHYCIQRNRANHYFKKSGLYLGSEEDDKHKIPAPLLETRLENHSFTDSTDWLLIAISGQPGSGKSQLANFISKKLSQDQKKTILEFSNSTRISLLEEILTTQNRESLMERLAGEFSQSRPNDFKDNPISHISFYDALISNLTSNQQYFMILMDDIDYYKGLKNKMINICNLWKIQAIVASRAEVKLPLNESSQLKRIRCQLWNKDESATILGEWLGSRNNIDNILKSKWLDKQSQFSLYTLRLVTEQLATQEDNPELLLKRIIRDQLSSMQTQLKGKMETDENKAILLVNRALELINNGNATIESIKEILSKNIGTDLIDLLGELSWFSRFHSAEKLTLEPTQVSQWSRGRLSDENARLFLLLGGDAGVFIYKPGSFASWANDKLVADGCAALHLEHTIKNVSKGEKMSLPLAEMVAELHASNSMDILSFSLELTSIYRLIDAISERGGKFVHLLNDLLNNLVIVRLEHAPEVAKRIVKLLFKWSQKLNPPEILKIAECLSQIQAAETIINDVICENKFNRNNTLKLAVFTKAFKSESLNDYFLEMDGLKVEPMTIVEIASYIFYEEGDEVFLTRFVNVIENSEYDERITSAWNSWCIRKTPNSLISVSTQLIIGKLNGRISSKALRVLIPYCAKHALSTWSNALDIYVDDLLTKITSLAKTDAKDVSEQLLKWIIPCYNPSSIFDKYDIPWIIDKNCKFAITSINMEQMKIKDIFEFISKSDRCFLPSKSELQEFALPLGSEELVSDGFPTNDFDGHRFIPNEFVFWDGNKETTFETREDIERNRVSWRIRFSIASTKKDTRLV